jgi:hypothetical protein
MVGRGGETMSKLTPAIKVLGEYVLYAESPSVRKSCKDAVRILEAAKKVDKAGVLSYYTDTMRLIYEDKPIPKNTWDYAIKTLLESIPEEEKK